VPPGALVDNRVAMNHVLGCLALLPVIWLAGYYWPRQARSQRPS
jgi:hypothetical protein